MSQLELAVSKRLYMIESFAFGGNLELPNSTPDFAVIATFATVEDFENYLADDFHQSVIKSDFCPSFGSATRFSSDVVKELPTLRVT